MNKKTGLTLEQHKELGNELVKMENQFEEIWTNLTNAYPKRKRIPRRYPKLPVFL